MDAIGERKGISPEFVCFTCGIIRMVGQSQKNTTRGSIHTGRGESQTRSNEKEKRGIASEAPPSPSFPERSM
jgi:hypothetical protein